jgi:hypothetical protein
MDDPFAISNSGVVLVNAMHFDGVTTVEQALARALREPSRVFVGVALDASEVSFVLEHLSELVDEPASFVIGRRQRLRKV